MLPGVGFAAVVSAYATRRLLPNNPSKPDSGLAPPDFPSEAEPPMDGEIICMHAGAGDRAHWCAECAGTRSPGCVPGLGPGLPVSRRLVCEHASMKGPPPHGSFV